jgi:hypothetical protein
MARRFNNLDAALRYLRPASSGSDGVVPDAPAGTPLKRYQDWKAGKVDIDYPRSASSNPGSLNKAKWYGRTLVKIDRWFPSSKRCGNCGHIVDKLPLNIREWDCPNCGTHHDRDINASQNILAVGHTVTVCGVNIRPDRHKSQGQLRKPVREGNRNLNREV